MKKLLFIFPVFFILFFQGCSWQEYFLVANTTDMDIIVEYEIDTTKKGFPIFDNFPSCYKTKNSGEIKWDAPLEIKDEDTARYVVRVILSPRTAVIFGHLSNDHYKNYKQEFINGRQFNLKRLLVQKGEFSRDISPENFDENVTKKHGMIYVKTK